MHTHSRIALLVLLKVQLKSAEENERHRRRAVDGYLCVIRHLRPRRACVCNSPPPRGKERGVEEEEDDDDEQEEEVPPAGTGGSGVVLGWWADGAGGAAVALFHCVLHLRARRAPRSHRTHR